MNPETLKIILGLIAAIITVLVFVWLFYKVTDMLSPKNVVSGIFDGGKQVGKEIVGSAKDLGKGAVKVLTSDQSKKIVNTAVKPIGKALTSDQSKKIVNTAAKPFQPKQAEKNVKKAGKSIKKAFKF